MGDNLMVCEGRKTFSALVALCRGAAPPAYAVASGMNLESQRNY